MSTCEETLLQVREIGDRESYHFGSHVGESRRADEA
jgi:hypothetical protein